MSGSIDYWFTLASPWAFLGHQAFLDLAKAQDVDVYVALDDNKVTGFAIVASEPRKFTILNIVGSIDLDQIAKLQNHMDLHVDLHDAMDFAP